MASHSTASAWKRKHERKVVSFGELNVAAISDGNGDVRCDITCETINGNDVMCRVDMYDMTTHGACETEDE